MSTTLSPGILMPPVQGQRQPKQGSLRQSQTSESYPLGLCDHSYRQVCGNRLPATVLIILDSLHKDSLGFLFIRGGDRRAS